MDKDLYQNLIDVLNIYYPQVGTIRASTISEAKKFWYNYELYKLFGPLPNIDFEDRSYLENLYFLVVNYSQTLLDFSSTFSHYVHLFYFNSETVSPKFAVDFISLVNKFLKNLSLPGLSDEQKENLNNFVSDFSSYELFVPLVTENLSFNKYKIGTIYRKALINGLKNISQDSPEYLKLKDLYTRIRNRTYEFFTQRNRGFYNILEQRGLVQIYESCFNASFEKQTIVIDNIEQEYRRAVRVIYDEKIEALLNPPYFPIISQIIGLDELRLSQLKEYLKDAL